MPSGLDFPSNLPTPNPAASVRFLFTGSALIPIYGAGGAGVTYLWKYRPRQQSGYYTSFFWANNGEFWWNNGSPASYYGAHPYPHNGTSPLFDTGIHHRWEISVEGIDPIDRDDAVVKGVWHSQAFRAWGGSGVKKQHEFYWNLPDLSANRVTYTSNSATWGDNAPPSPALTWGDAPWRPCVERASGILRGWQIYNAPLTAEQIVALAGCDTDEEVLAEASVQGVDGALWYLNMNPSDASDISDKSGNGNDPAWFNNNRPDFWSEADPEPEPVPVPEVVAIRAGNGLGGLG